MKCSHCRKILEDDWLFCPKCGGQIKGASESGAAKKLSRSFQNEEVEHFAQYGSALRDQVFEVVVRHALAGAPWKEICAGPMFVNDIDPLEIEAEVSRRKGLPSSPVLQSVGETPAKKPGTLLKFPRPSTGKEKPKAGTEEKGETDPPEKV
jgi:zinc-ribbon domain